MIYNKTCVEEEKGEVFGNMRRLLTESKRNRAWG